MAKKSNVEFQAGIDRVANLVPNGQLAASMGAVFFLDAVANHLVATEARIKRLVNDLEAEGVAITTYRARLGEAERCAGVMQGRFDEAMNQVERLTKERDRAYAAARADVLDEVSYRWEKRNEAGKPFSDWLWEWVERARDALLALAAADPPVAVAIERTGGRRAPSYAAIARAISSPPPEREPGT
jgi:hypothetical protein